MAVRQLKRLLCGIAVMLVLVASITCVCAKALDNGIYIADCNASYTHPVTGEIEDSGGESSAVLGQSMCEGATYSHALIEVDSDGKVYVTVRFTLMGNIKNPSFKVQKNSSSSFTSVTATLMQQNDSENTGDYRFEIPSEDCIVRCSIYVIAMGRDVVYYMTFSNLSEGSEDFVTSVEVKSDESSSQSSTDSTQSSTSNRGSSSSQSTTSSRSSSSSASSASSGNSSTSSTQNDSQSSDTQIDNSSSQQSVSQNEEISDQDSSEQQSDSDDVSQEDSSQIDAVTHLDFAADGSSDSDSNVSASNSEVESSYEYSSDDLDVEGLRIYDEEGNLIEMFSSENETDESASSGDSSSVAGLAVGIVAGAVIIAGSAGIVVWRKRRL